MKGGSCSSCLARNLANVTRTAIRWLSPSLLTTVFGTKSCIGFSTSKIRVRGPSINDIRKGFGFLSHLPLVCIWNWEIITPLLRVSWVLLAPQECNNHILIQLVQLFSDRENPLSALQMTPLLVTPSSFTSE